MAGTNTVKVDGNKFSKFILKWRWEIVFLASLVFGAYIYLQYFAKISFPDEYDNLANTWLITKGLVPYRDYFSNHFPILFILGIPAELFSHSKIAYRIEVFLLYFSFFTASFVYLKNYLKLSIIPFILFSSFAIALFGGQQFADGTVWTIFLLCAFFIVANNLTNPLSKRETIAFSLLMLATFFSSPMHVLGFIFLICFHLLSQKKQPQLIQKNIANLKTLIISIVIPVGILGLYLILTGSLADFYQATISYNGKFYYYHIYPNPYVNFHPIDYYLHTTRDFFNHIFEIIKFQGPYLVRFLQALKSIVFKPNLALDTSYLKIIFSMFLDHFLTFEVLILAFYLCGFLALLRRNKSLAIFSLLFIFTLRVRINERIHMAPYYLFSYWMVAVAVTIFLQDLSNKKRLILNSFALFATLLVVIVFIQKNTFDFQQIAYNRFSYGYEETAAYLKNIAKNEKIIALAPFSAAYYYESSHLPGSYFINYYDFFNWSPALENRWLAGLEKYHGNYLIIGPSIWEPESGKIGAEWLVPTVNLIKNNYTRNQLPVPDYVFKRN